MRGRITARARAGAGAMTDVGERYGSWRIVKANLRESHSRKSEREVGCAASQARKRNEKGGEWATVLPGSQRGQTRGVL